ncbi:MAG: 2-hydroxyacyl-CoA dehydratase family protein [Planctomycetota bacterium]
MVTEPSIDRLDVEETDFQSIFPDPAPAKMTLEGWHERFKSVPDAVLEAYRYYRHVGTTPWNAYLQPPSYFHIYGMRVMRRLKFDNGLAALRLWGFILNEGERLFRAKQAGMKVVALMGDYGGIAPLVYSFPGLVPFYPDYQYWMPFLAESNVLFESADTAGIGENCCFVRAALGAFLRGGYFPEPDLVIVSTGAACDDVGAVAQRVHDLGYPTVWTELPWRKTVHPWYEHLEADESPGKIPFDTAAREILVEEYGGLCAALAELSGVPHDEGRLADTLSKVEEGRRSIRRIRELAFSSSPTPLPALELMQVEFAGPAFYADLDECLDVLGDVQSTVEKRASAGVGFGEIDASPVAWATPPADPLLLNRLEDLGGRLAGTEFMVAQSRAPIDLARPPLAALAESFLQGSLLGSGQSRAEDLCREARGFGARGAVISGIFASSHCVSETRILREELSKRLEGPVLTFDVPSPGGRGLRNPVENRLAAYLEALKRRSHSVSELQS